MDRLDYYSGHVMTARESRVEKAAATRRRVLEQALTLFLEQGFAATTTREIADRAHVTERTLFNLAANKSDLLRQVLLTFVFTDDFGPLLERKDFQPVLRTHTVAAFLTEFTHWVDNLHQQTSAAAEMTRAAAGADRRRSRDLDLGKPATDHRPAQPVHRAAPTRMAPTRTLSRRGGQFPRRLVRTRNLLAAGHRATVEPLPVPPLASPPLRRRTQHLNGQDAPVRAPTGAPFCVRRAAQVVEISTRRVCESRQG